MLWLTLILTATLFARDISFEEWCGEIGGYYIHPELSLIKTGPGECHCLEQIGGINRRASPPNDRCSAITEERLCTHPARYICQSEEANEAAKNHDSYYDAVEAAKGSERVQAVMKGWSWKSQKAVEDGKFNELNPVERTALNYVMNQELDRNYYQKNNRIQKVDEAFKRAKSTILALLQDRIAKHPEQKSALEGMMETIRRATHIVGWTQPTADGLLPHNMAALTDPKDADRPNKILVGTVISELDSSPEGFYFGMLHEFSHFIDPKRYRGDKHPFQLEIDCLRNPGTIGAKTAAAGGRDQIGESFADWMAMQAWLKEHPKLEPATERVNLKKPKQSTYEKIDQRVDVLSTWNAKGNTLQHLRELNAVTCGAYRYFERVKDITRENNKDEHPLGIDRAEALLSSPAIKRALGCSEQFILTMKTPNDKVPQGVTANCGDDLRAQRGEWKPRRPAGERLPPVEPQRRHERK